MEKDRRRKNGRRGRKRETERGSELFAKLRPSITEINGDILFHLLLCFLLEMLHISSKLDIAELYFLILIHLERDNDFTNFIIRHEHAREERSLINDWSTLNNQ